MLLCMWLHLLVVYSSIANCVAAFARVCFILGSKRHGARRGRIIGDDCELLLCVGSFFDVCLGSGMLNVGKLYFILSEVLSFLYLCDFKFELFFFVCR